MMVGWGNRVVYDAGDFALVQSEAHGDAVALEWEDEWSVSLGLHVACLRALNGALMAPGPMVLVDEAGLSMLAGVVREVIETAQEMR